MKNLYIKQTIRTSLLFLILITAISLNLSAQSWSKTGDTATHSTTNWIGTNDNSSFSIHVHGQPYAYFDSGGTSMSLMQAAGIVKNLVGTLFIGDSAGNGSTSSNYSTFIGINAGISNVSAYESNFIGDFAGQYGANSAGCNFIGANTGASATGSNNTSNFIGYWTGQGASGTIGSNFIGYFVGYQSSNTAESNMIGTYAGYQSSGVGYSNFIGVQAGWVANNSWYCNFIGNQAGSYVSNSTSSNFIGIFAGLSAVNCASSNFIGVNAGYGAANATGSNFIGTNAGINDSASYSNFIGNQTGANSLPVTNATAIGSNTKVLCSNCMSLTDSTDIYAVGIGYETPAAILRGRTGLAINGKFALIDSTQANGYVLTSDSNGLASWKSSSNTAWSLKGNAGTDTTINFIGTLDSTFFAIRVKNSEAMRIAANGNVGIGVKTPTVKLQVNGSISLDNEAYDGNASFFFGKERTPNGFGKWGIQYTPASPGTGYIGPQGGLNFWVPYDPTDGNVDANGNLFLSDNGRVGIGTYTPSQKLEIAHNDTSGGIVLNRLSSVTSKSQVSFRQLGTEKWSVGIDANENDSDNFYIWSGTSHSVKLFIDTSSVGIGTTTPNHAYKLDVVGKIRSCEVKINSVTGCDYVFDENYKLRSLADLDSYLKANKHLPDIAPAADMETNGVDLGQLQTGLLKKIEELTLYVISQNEKIEALEKKVSALSTDKK